MKVKVFDELIISEDHSRVDGKPFESTLGKHCVWIPSLEMKVILSFNGYIESTRWAAGRKAKEIRDKTINPGPGFTMESLYSIANEIRLLQLLAQHNMSPEPKNYFYFKTSTSKIFTSELYEDKKGIFGYYVQNANSLPPGRYNFDKFKKLFLDTGRIKANPGAIGDLAKKDGNLVNGYLVDVRRTMEYMMQVNEELNINILLQILTQLNRI